MLFPFQFVPVQFAQRACRNFMPQMQFFSVEIDAISISLFSKYCKTPRNIYLFLSQAISQSMFRKSSISSLEIHRHCNLPDTVFSNLNSIIRTRKQTEMTQTYLDVVEESERDGVGARQ